MRPGPPPIEDEFTHLLVSRQRKYQLRMVRDGRCHKCGTPALNGTCPKHLEYQRRANRKRYLATLARSRAQNGQAGQAEGCAGGNKA